MMLDCWKSEAQERPNFAELVSRLTSDLVIKEDHEDINEENLTEIQY